MVKKQELNESMIANELEPFEPTHPGEVLKEEIEYPKGNLLTKLACPVLYSTKC